jgi:UDP-N-acetylglucosamine acyltransferase
MSNLLIHPTAIIDPRAKLGKDVRVGAYTVIDGDVAIGNGTEIGHHCVITGHTQIGEGNKIYHFVSLGEANQDKKYKGEPTKTIIGARNTIRESCTINRGTVQDQGITRVGDDNWLMAYVHIAHDCVVGNNTTLANCTQLAGHVHLGDYAVLGGFTGVHQYVHIGAHVMCGVSSVVLMDIPAYMTVGGQPLRVAGFNREGLKRRGFSEAQLANIKTAFKIIFRDGNTLDTAKNLLAALPQEAREISVLLDSLTQATRGIVR